VDEAYGNEFAIGKDEKLPADNISKMVRPQRKIRIRRFRSVWLQRNVPARIMDLRDGTAESQHQFFDMTRRGSTSSTMRSRATRSVFSQSESNIAELLREVVRKNLPN